MTSLGQEKGNILHVVSRINSAGIVIGNFVKLVKIVETRPLARYMHKIY
jgi:hypothetical protein